MASVIIGVGNGTNNTFVNFWSWGAGQRKLTLVSGNGTNVTFWK